MGSDQALISEFRAILDRAEAVRHVNGLIKLLQVRFDESKGYQERQINLGIYIDQLKAERDLLDDDLVETTPDILTICYRAIHVYSVYVSLDESLTVAKLYMASMNKSDKDKTINSGPGIAIF